MAKYVYPAIIRPDGGLFAVYFPDVPSATTSGDTLQDALEMAEDSLNLALYMTEKERETIPAVTPVGEVESLPNDIVTLVKADTEAYGREIESIAVKKTLSIPSWLNVKAERANVNFSQTLQEALKEKLGLKNI